MRRLILPAAILVASACAEEFRPMPGPAPQTTLTRDAGPTPIPTPVQGLASVLVTDQWTEDPGAGVTIFSTFDDAIVDEATTDSSGEVQILVVDGGELTAVNEPGGPNVSIFDVEPGGSYRIRLFGFGGISPTLYPPAVQITVHGLTPGEYWRARIAYNCQTGGVATSSTETKTLQPTWICIRPDQSTFDVLAVQGSRAGLAYAVALGTTALEVTLGDPLPTIELEGELPDWPSDDNSTIDVGSVRDGSCTYSDRLAPIPADSWNLPAGVADSADLVSFYLYHGSTGPERAARVLREPSGAIDLGLDFDRLDDVPPIPSFHTSDGVEATWDPLGPDENIVIFSGFGSASWMRLSFLPAGSTHVRLPKLPTDDGVPTHFGFGTFAFDDGASHFEYGRIDDCRYTHWHVYNGFSSALF